MSDRSARGPVAEVAVAHLLGSLRDLQVRVWVDGDRLRVSAPQGALTPEIQSELARRKPEILDYLRETGHPERPALGSVVRSGPLALSFAQERLWFLQRLEPHSVAYNLQANIRFDGALDGKALEQALAALVRRHELLRSRFPEVDGRPVLRIDEPATPGHGLSDLSALPEADRAREADRVATLEIRRPFDLANGPVCRFHLLRLREDRHELLVTQHHIVTDGWSIALLVREVLGLYAAFREGRAEPPAPALQYADFAAWQRSWLQGEVLEDRLAYW